MRASCKALVVVLLATSVARAQEGDGSAPPPAPEPKGPRQGVDRIAAVIEDEIITLRELEARARPYMTQLEGIEDVKQREERRRAILKQVLDIEIGERIVTRELGQHKDRLGVTEQDVDRAVQEVLRMNNLTEEQLQAALYGQGMTWAEYRKKLREQIERAQLIQLKVRGRVQVKESDVLRRCSDRQKNGGDQVKVCASHILLNVPKDATPQEIEALRAKASQLQSELAAGADFAAYALRHSADKGAPDGKLGCFGRGEMVEEFEDTAFKLQVGQVSKVIRTQFGLHIIKVTDRQAAPAQTCEGEQALAPFRNELYQEEMERQMNAWMQELRQKAFVDVRL